MPSHVTTTYFFAPDPIPQALAKIYAAKNELCAAFPDHSFTMDGKFIGDIGEAIAQQHFGLSKLRVGEKDHDFKTADGRLVQVKATQKAKRESAGVGLGLVKRTFDLLLVIEFDQSGRYEVLYNGPGKYIDDARNHKTSASMSRNQLRQCQLLVAEEHRISRVCGIPCAA